MGYSHAVVPAGYTWGNYPFYYVQGERYPASAPASQFPADTFSPGEAGDAGLIPPPSHSGYNELIPPPPPTLHGGRVTPRGEAEFPPPPPPVNGNSGTVDGVSWGAADSSGMQTGTDSKGDTYQYDPAAGMITNEGNGQTFRVKTLTSQHGRAIANFSYGSQMPGGKVQILSSNGRLFTYHPDPGANPGQAGYIEKHRTGQDFTVTERELPDGQYVLNTLGPDVTRFNGMTGFYWTGQLGHDPWATAHE